MKEMIIGQNAVDYSKDQKSVPLSITVLSANFLNSIRIVIVSVNGLLANDFISASVIPYCISPDLSNSLLIYTILCSNIALFVSSTRNSILLHASHLYFIWEERRLWYIVSIKLKVWNYLFFINLNYPLWFRVQCFLFLACVLNLIEQHGQKVEVVNI